MRCRRVTGRPRIASAAGLAAITRPLASKVITPSLSALISDRCWATLSRSAVSASRRAVMSVWTMTTPPAGVSMGVAVSWNHCECPSRGSA